jgi:hypothetical protein
MKYMLLIYHGTAKRTMPKPRSSSPRAIPAARLGGAVEVRPVMEP